MATTVSRRRADLSDEDAIAIVASGIALTELDLAANPIGPAVAQAIAAAPHLAGLRVLDLAQTKIGRAGVDALIESPYLSRELELKVDADLVGRYLEADYDSDGFVRPYGRWAGDVDERALQRFPKLASLVG